MAHPGQRCSVLRPHSPLAAHVGLPNKAKRHCVPGPAGTLGTSGRQAVWGAQGAARSWGCQGPGNIQHPEENPRPVEHLGPGGIEDVRGASRTWGHWGAAAASSSWGHPEPWVASGTLLCTEYPASPRIQAASSPRGNPVPSWASSTWEHLGPQERTWDPAGHWDMGLSGIWGCTHILGGHPVRSCIPYPAASHTQQHPVPSSIPYREPQPRATPHWLPGTPFPPDRPKPLWSPLGLSEPRKQQSPAWVRAGCTQLAGRCPPSPIPPDSHGDSKGRAGTARHGTARHGTPRGEGGPCTHLIAQQHDDHVLLGVLVDLRQPGLRGSRAVSG